MLKSLKMVFVVASLVLFVGPAFAQTVDTAWVRTYNGPADSSDNARAIAVDDSGNVYVTGWSYDTGTDEDYLTIKYYPDGDTGWVRRYNHPGNGIDRASDLAADDSNNVYVTGGSGTIKYDTDGNQLWIKPWGGSDIAIDDSGNVYVTGTSAQDYVTVKYYPDGDTAWVRTYDGPASGFDGASALVVDSSGNVFVTGVSDSTGIDWDWDYVTIKYDSLGNEHWVSRYTGLGNSNELAPVLAVDPFGNIYVNGVRDSGSVSYYVTIRYDPQSGDTLWVRQYIGQFGMEASGHIAIDAEGDICVTGGSLYSEATMDYATVKYHPNGDTAWLRLYDGPGKSVDISWALAIDLEGNIYVTGGSWGTDRRDYATVKYSPTGDMCWDIRYNGPGNSYDDAFAIAVDGFGNVYVAGSSRGSGTGYDYATIKYVQTTDVKDATETEGKPADLSLSQNYPNPFNPATTLHFTVGSPQSAVRSPIHTTLKIYNVLGEEVRNLVNEEKLPGDYTVQWDGKNDRGEQSASGVYFYELKVGGYTSSKKMLLLK